jgi:hypothetical protein
MRQWIVVLPVVCLAAVAWPLLSTEGRPADLDGLIVGRPHRHANLTIFPVIARESRTQDRFITLDEGLAAGTVEIFEVGTDGARLGESANAPAAPTTSDGPTAEDGAAEAEGQPPGAPAGEPQPQIAQDAVPQQALEQPAIQQVTPDVLDNNFFGESAPPVADVNRLMVINRSGKPLYLMPGEVIVGGRQDRSIAEETILASTGEPVPVAVFCVEHGRWSGRDEQQAAQILAAVAEPRDGAGAAEHEATLSLIVRQANSGKFVASAGSLSKLSRFACVASKDQSEVWDAVAHANTAAGVSPESGAFTANYVNPASRQRLEPYLDRLQGRLADEPRVVGVVVAINGKVEAVDVFESTPLFRKLWPKLLKSYALDAAAQADAPHRSPAPRVASARDFLCKALTADVQQESRNQGGLVVQQRAASGVVSFSAGAPADVALPSSGGFGGAVHASAFAD